MKTPKKPTQKDTINKPISNQNDEEEEDDLQEIETTEEEVEDFDVPLDDLATFSDFEDDDDDDTY